MHKLAKYVISVNDTRLQQFQFDMKHSGYNVVPFEGVKKQKVGCTLSHLNLWKHIVDTNTEPAVIIFEDDAKQIRPYSTQDDTAFEHFLLDSNVGIFLLGWNPRDSHATEQKPHYYTGHALDSHAYILKTSFARKYIKKYGQIFENQFHQMFAPAGTIDTIFVIEKVALSVPMIFIQHGDERYNKPVNITNRIINKMSLKLLSLRISNYCVFHKYMIIIIEIIVLLKYARLQH